jgi:hypothetical protein
MPVVSGLMCTHADCYALFISLEDSEEHAISTHGGNVAAITCGVYECRDESKTTQLYRVLNKDGEYSNKFATPTVKLTKAPSTSYSTMFTAITSTTAIITPSCSAFRLFAAPAIKSTKLIITPYYSTVFAKASLRSINEIHS